MELEPSDYIAIGAAVIAAIAVVFAWQSTKQAKRQADAVLGNISPSFGMYQSQIKPFELMAELHLEIINFNRKALLIHSISIEHPESVIIFPDHQEQSDTIRAIIEAVVESDNTHKFIVPHRIRGNGLHSEPHSLILPFICDWCVDEVYPKRSVKVCFQIEFSLEGDREVKFAYGCVLAHPFVQMS